VQSSDAEWQLLKRGHDDPRKFEKPELTKATQGNRTQDP
jgi:hypothetical protein